MLTSLILQNGDWHLVHALQDTYGQCVDSVRVRNANAAEYKCVIWKQEIIFIREALPVSRGYSFALACCCGGLPLDSHRRLRVGVHVPPRQSFPAFQAERIDFIL